MTRIIGVTGGIGSGKSTLTRRFSDHGFPAVDADAIARTALTPASACFEDAIALFGSEALLPDGTANRAYIASRVFQDPSLREQLNGIIHPFVLREMLRISEESEVPLAVWDVPLLFESGADAFCACTVAVLCGEDIRVARVAARDHAEESAIRARIEAQMTDEQRAALATYTIRNEDSPEVFYREADELIERIQRELI